MSIEIGDTHSLETLLEICQMLTKIYDLQSKFFCEVQEKLEKIIPTTPTNFQEEEDDVGLMFR
jgi:hypothetical protein